MNQLKAQFLVFWAAREPRERTFLVTLVVLVVLALVSQTLWSTYQARTRLRKQIPELAHQVEDLQRKANELQQIKSQPPAALPADGNALLATATAAANSVRLPEVVSQMKLEGPRRMRVRGALPFDRWLDWTAALQRDGQIRLVSCRIDTGVGPGTAMIDALFALPEPG